MGHYQVITDKLPQELAQCQTLSNFNYTSFYFLSFFTNAVLHWLVKFRFKFKKADLLICRCCTG